MAGAGGASGARGSAMPTADTCFAYGPFKGNKFGNVKYSKDPEKIAWIATLRRTPQTKLAIYQKAFLEWLDDETDSQTMVLDEGFLVPDSQCEHDFKTTKGTNAYVARYECIKCGFRTTKRTDELKYTDAATCPHNNLISKSYTTSTLQQSTTTHFHPIHPHHPVFHIVHHIHTTSFRNHPVSPHTPTTTIFRCRTLHPHYISPRRPTSTPYYTTS